MKKIIQDLSKTELSELFALYGEKGFRSSQVFDGINQGKSISEISTISKTLKEKLLENFEDSPLKIHSSFVGKDGTRKYVFALSDGALIEGVLMKYKYGNTLCVSTQVGCRMGCKFCASTLGGLIRNLTPGEILSEILVVNRELGGKEKEKRAITNVVLMGSGEPLDNFENVTKFLSLISSSEGLNISQRNISLSTCGICPKIKELADRGFSVTLTISLHNPLDEERKKIMPIANSYRIDEILDAAKYYFEKTGRRIIFEYALIKDQNDTKECIDEIEKKFKGFPLHFNIIPLNEVKENTTLKSAGRKAAYQFSGELERRKISSTVRRTMGEDIGGACGQLRNKIINNNKN